VNAKGWFEMLKRGFDTGYLILCETVILDFTIKKKLGGRKSLPYVNNSSLNLHGRNVSKTKLHPGRRNW
jgi:hypothetical protein